MRHYKVITGPIRATTEYGPDGASYPVASFEDHLNTFLDSLAEDDTPDLRVECQPATRDGWVVAFVSYLTTAPGTLRPQKPATVTIQQLANDLNVSRWFVSDRIRRGEIQAIDLGKRKVIPRTEADRLLGRSNR